MEREQYRDGSVVHDAFEHLDRTVISCPHAECSSTTAAAVVDAGFACPSCGTPAVVKQLDGITWVSWGSDDGYAETVILPELPRERQERFVEEYGLNRETASKLTTSKALGDFFEALAERTGAVQTAATFTADMLLGELRYRDMTIEVVAPEDVEETVSALASNDVTEQKVTTVLREALDNGRMIDSVFTETDTSKTSEAALSEIAEDIIASETGAVEDYRQGETEALNYLVGQVIARTDGAADAREARRTFKTLLDETNE